MDLASLIGFLGAVGAIVATMIMGGGVAPFIDTQSIFIVFGGTFFALCIKTHFQFSLEALARCPKHSCRLLKRWTRL